MTNILDMLKGYKTITFNVLAMLVAIAQYYWGPLPVVDGEQFAFLIAIGNFALRFVTKTPVFKATV